MLAGMGFENIYNLQGGIKAWQGEKATGPVELNMDLIRGDETPAEITAFAFGMEKGLQTFYAAKRWQMLQYATIAKTGMILVDSNRSRSF